MSVAVTEVLEVEEAEPRGRGRLLVLVVALVVVLGGGAAAWFLLFAGGDEDPDVADAPAAEGVIVTLEPLTTTVGQDTLRHARVALAVVLTEDGDPTEVVAKQALLKDALLREVALLDADRLRSAEGSEALRAALTADAHEIWGEEVVARVVLTELLVQ